MACIWNNQSDSFIRSRRSIKISQYVRLIYNSRWEIGFRKRDLGPISTPSLVNTVFLFRWSVDGSLCRRSQISPSLRGAYESHSDKNEWKWSKSPVVVASKWRLKHVVIDLFPIRIFRIRCQLANKKHRIRVGLTHFFGIRLENIKRETDLCSCLLGHQRGTAYWWSRGSNSRYLPVYRELFQSGSISFSNFDSSLPGMERQRPHQSFALF